MEKSALLVDSSFFIELLQKGLDPGTELLREVELLDLATTGMIRLEVVRGISAPKLRARVEDFMSVMINVPNNNKLWMEATQMAWELGREGWTMPAADILIAAAAFRIDAAVLTLDKHFSAIPGLTVFRSLDELH